MTDTSPKKCPDELLAEAGKIVPLPDDWPIEFSPEDFICLMAGSRALSVEQQQRHSVCSSMVRRAMDMHILEVRHEPQAPKRIEMIVAPGASDETKALATHRANHPFFGECDAYYRYEPLPDKPYITRESARAWLSSRQIEPNELIAEWLRVGGIEIGANQTARQAVRPPTDGPEKQTAPEEILRKRNALIAEFKGMWPTIGNDLYEGSDNGLSEAARTKKYGIWKVREALKWAAVQGKIKPEKAEAFVQAEGDSDLSFFISDLLKQGRK